MIRTPRRPTNPRRGARPTLAEAPEDASPRAHPWDRAQIDPARMAELVNAMRTGQLGSYRPDHP